MSYYVACLNVNKFGLNTTILNVIICMASLISCCVTREQIKVSNVDKSVAEELESKIIYYDERYP